MSRNKTSLSHAASYKAVGEFWDTHDVTEFWEKTEDASFEVAIESETTYFAIDRDLTEKVHAIALKRGVSADTLVNLWVQEKVREQA